MRLRFKMPAGQRPLLAAIFACLLSGPMVSAIANPLTSPLTTPLTSPRAPAGETVRCHITYGGETRTLTIRATTKPYAVAPESIGSYFLLRVVFEAPPAPLPAIKVYTYANLDEGPLPIHMAEFPYPASRKSGAPGFTGYQRVYEPVRDGELQYWCALSKRAS